MCCSPINHIAPPYTRSWTIWSGNAQLALPRAKATISIKDISFFCKHATESSSDPCALLDHPYLACAFSIAVKSALMMFWSALLFAAAAKGQFSQGLNHLRFGCSQLTVERLDPLVNPGMIGTPHTHQIIGGNAFNATIPSTDVSSLATCTTCGPADDRSN